MFARELQDLIIDQLHEDKEALFTCSLVSSWWLERARGSRFLDRPLVITSHSQDTEGFIELLFAPHSTLGRHIHYIWIDGPLKDSRMRGTPEDYVQLCRHIQDIIPHLPCVHALTFTHIVWNAIDEETKAHLRSLKGVTNLGWSTTVIDHLRDLILFTSENYLALESLEVDFIITGDNTEDGVLTLPPVFSPRFASLRAVKLYAQFNSTAPLFLPAPGNLLPLHNLHTLSLTAIGVQKNDMHLWASLLNAVGPVLKTLELHLYVRFTFNEGPQ
ncbi:hypothetical protein C0991_008488, partial [Blastosporella zonata]